MKRPHLVHWLLPTAALLGACGSTPEADVPAPPIRSASGSALDEAPDRESADRESADRGSQDRASEDGSDTADEALAEKKRELERAHRHADRQHALEQARIDLALAELEVAASRRKAERAVVEARREVDEAQRALAVFLERERPRELAGGRLGLDRAAHRLELEQDELAELTAMYAAEDFAEMTKELVLKRGRKGVEFAERGLELERQKLALLEEETLAKKERDLRAVLAKAQHGLAEAEAGLEQAGLQAEKKLAGARNAIDKLERPDPKDLEDGNA